MNAAVGGITEQLPDIYEGQYVYWPWARTVHAANDLIQAFAPSHGTVLDYMCGTGHLLAQLHAKRSDLRCVGCDLDRSFIEYGRRRCHTIELVSCGALDYTPDGSVDVIVCTGGLHHLPRRHRPRFLAKCAQELSQDGRLVVAEELIATDEDTTARRSAVVELYRAMLEHLISAEAPAEILDSAVSAMRKELLEEGTSKETSSSLLALLTERFEVVEQHRIWPDVDAGYGDVVLVCAPRHHAAHQEVLTEIPAARTGGRFDPPPAYRRLREIEPLARVTLWDSSRVWFAMRHADMRTVLGDERFSADVTRPGFPRVTPTSETVSEEFRTLIRMDPPEHERLRRALSPEFTAARAEAVRPMITATVREAITQMTAHRPPVDLIQTVAVVVSARVIGQMLGVAYDTHLELQQLSLRSQTMRPSADDVDRDLNELHRRLSNLVEAKYDRPGDDLLSRLMHPCDGRQPLDPDAVVGIARLFLLPTADIVAHMIGLGFLALHEHRAQLTRLRRDPQLIGSATEELLRFLSVLHTGIPRVAREDVQISGRQIKVGEGVICALPIANRDQDAFPDADRLDITRDARRHLAFGHGIHRCLGQFLARVEIEETLAALLTRPPWVHPVADADQLRFRDDMLVYGVHELPVSWDTSSSAR